MRKNYRFVAWLSGAVGFTLSIVAIEALLHGIEHSPAWRILPIVERELGWPDPNRGYALRPNQEIINARENRSRPSTNSFGMRDSERSLTKPPHTFRLAVTGDSFTEALQVSDKSTFTRLAEIALNTGLNRKRYEILNFGFSGAGPVQQLVQLHHQVIRFNPDAVVMIINVSHFTGDELSDDSLNPAYIYNSDGELELGYSFRNRRSQRYRNTLVGKLFFLLMDDSRVARAIYLRYVNGIGLAAAAQLYDRQAVPTCSFLVAEIDRHLKLWSAHAPTPAFARVEKFIADIAGVRLGEKIPVDLVLYGIGDVRADCVDFSLKREALVAAIESTLSLHGLRLWDADRAVRSGFAHDNEPLSRYYGFGRERGVGHLNYSGHHAYSELLQEVVRSLSTDDHK